MRVAAAAAAVLTATRNWQRHTSTQAHTRRHAYNTHTRTHMHLEEVHRCTFKGQGVIKVINGVVLFTLGRV